MDSESSNKIVGYTLLALGLIIIIFSGFKVYRVFTGAENPYQIFSLSGISVDLGKAIGQTSDANLTQELLNSDVLNKPLNYAFYIMLMGFISSVGFKIASLGVQLARTLKVTLKEKVSQNPVV